MGTYADPDYQKKYREANKEKRNAYLREWSARNKERIRGYNLKAKYGINYKDYLSILDACNHSCELCGSEKHLHLDHCHETGKIRGILCFGCNGALGKLGDNEESILKVLQYLKREYANVK